MTQRILLNLLSNAFKFVPNGGSIFVELSQRNHSALISVQDNGPGIPHQYRDEVFERFKQLDSSDARRFSGTGLGLSIVKEFVDLQSGAIRILDAPGGGAFFQVELPTAAPHGTKVIQGKSNLFSYENTSHTIHELKQNIRAQHKASSNIKGEKGLVLVVEDNTDMNEFIVNTLAENYQVASAFNGLEGLEKAILLKPDLILSDIMMPEMSGNTMIDKIRARTDCSDIPIILLTAKSDDDLKNHLLKNQVQDYITKPFSSEELLARVNNLVTMKRTKNVLQQGITNQQKNIEKLAQEVTVHAKDLERALLIRDEFLSIASHELKTPLTSLKLQLQMTDRKIKKPFNLPEPNELKKCFTMSLKQVDSLTDLVDELLDVSRINSGRMTYTFEAVDFSLLVQDIVERFSEQLKSAKCTLSLHLDKHILGYWDRNRIGQVVTNLLSNVIKYASGKPVRIEARQMDHFVTLTIQDSGPGILEDKQSVIFDRFERAGASQSVGGLGLGLFITKKIIEAHCGSIRLESKPGKGSKFIIELPIKPFEFEKEHLHEQVTV